MRIEFRTWRCLYVGAGLIAFALGMYLWPGDLTGTRFTESGPIELITAFAYAFAASAAAIAAARADSPFRWYLIMWMVLCVVFFGEETSWLQHMIGYETPAEIAALNAQSEFNLHNLNVLYSVGVFDDPLNWRLLYQSHNLFRMGFIAYFLILPVLAYLAWSGRLIDKFAFPYPGLRFLATFWPSIVISHILIVSSTHPLRAAMSETLELIYALAIAGFVVMASLKSRGYARQKNSIQRVSLSVEF